MPTRPPQRNVTLAWTEPSPVALALSGPCDVRALKIDDLYAVYQPIVNLETGRIFAHEVLARCFREEFASPITLFEHASAQAYCGPLGRMIREIALAPCTREPLFVNVHPDELCQRWLIQPDDPIVFHEAPLFIEITESVPFSHFDLCMSVIRELRSRIRLELVVDDLGAGYSNLKRICDLEPAVVKLDRELVAGIDTSRRQQILAAGVVRLCVDLGAKVVAEGIETEAELHAVRDAGAHLAQGFFLARPARAQPSLIPGRLSIQPVAGSGLA